MMFLSWDDEEGNIHIAVKGVEDERVKIIELCKKWRKRGHIIDNVAIS